MALMGRFCLLGPVELNGLGCGAGCRLRIGVRRLISFSDFAVKTIVSRRGRGEQWTVSSTSGVSRMLVTVDVQG